jgi:glucan phosphoethanolaminetransferase (alkaline phosphatase superfamily)
MMMMILIVVILILMIIINIVVIIRRKTTTTTTIIMIMILIVTLILMIIVTVRLNLSYIVHSGPYCPHSFVPGNANPLMSLTSKNTYNMSATNTAHKALALDACF